MNKISINKISINKISINKISIIGGCGNMSRAIISGMIKKKIIKPNQIIISDKNNKNYPFFKKKGIETVETNREAIEKSNIVIFAIKPQSIPEICNELKDLDLKNHLILSIVAGIPIQYYQNTLNIHKIARIMPNMPSTINKGMSAWYPSNCNVDDL